MAGGVTNSAKHQPHLLFTQANIFTCVCVCSMLTGSHIIDTNKVYILLHVDMMALLLLPVVLLLVIITMTYNM